MTKEIYYLSAPHAREGAPYKMLVKDESGNLISEYTAYYNAKRNTFKCYPTHNPFARKKTGLKAHEISAIYVKYI